MNRYIRITEVLSLIHMILSFVLIFIGYIFPGLMIGASLVSKVLMIYTVVYGVYSLFSYGLLVTYIPEEKKQRLSASVPLVYHIIRCLCLIHLLIIVFQKPPALENGSSITRMKVIAGLTILAALQSQRMIAAICLKAHNSECSRSINQIIYGSSQKDVYPSSFEGNCENSDGIKTEHDQLE